MNTRLQSLLPRIASKWVDLRADVQTAFDIVDAFSTKAKAIRADPNLTFQGKASALKATLGGGGHLDHIAQLRAKIERQKAELASRRTALTARRPVADALSFQQQAEVRGWLRGLDPAERRRAVLNATDPAIREAVANAPAELSGLDPDFHRAVIEQLTVAANEAALSELEQAETAVDEALGAIAVAEADLKGEAE